MTTNRIGSETAQVELAEVAVWLGCRASIWAHRGYRVAGETVYCSSRSDATRVVRESLQDGAVRVRADDGDYWYATQADADADDSGCAADAVVSRSEEG